MPCVPSADSEVPDGGERVESVGGRDAGRDGASGAHSS